MVLRVESGDGGLGDNKELINVLSVSEVLVKVILEVLNKVHVLLDEVVSSNSLESEGLIEELVGVDSHLWVFTGLLELSIDGHSVGVVSLIESSTEFFELEGKLLLCVWDWGWASIKEDLVVDNLVTGGGSNLVLELNGLDGSDSQEGEYGEFHSSIKKQQRLTGSIALNLQKYNIII